jgi:cysteinyl-tRNA synthetase
VHHTNEIAEAEAAYDEPLANYWLHCNHVTSEGRKISKSLGNGYSLDDLEKKGYTGLDYKMWALQGNYQAERNFSFDDLKAAAIRLKNYKNWAVLRYQIKVADKTGLEELKKRMMDHLTNNLNSAGALAELDKAIDVLVPDDNFVRFLDEAFGLNLSAINDINNETKAKITARNEAKNNKNYETADKIRDELLANGIKLEDRADKVLWQLV